MKKLQCPKCGKNDLVIEHHETTRQHETAEIGEDGLLEGKSDYWERLIEGGNLLDCTNGYLVCLDCDESVAIDGPGIAIPEGWSVDASDDGARAEAHP